MTPDAAAWVLEASDRTPAEARRHARRLLVERGSDPHLVDDALLVLSELVTNAVRLPGSTRVSVTVDARPGRVRLEVGDEVADAVPHVVRERSPDRAGGLGLRIVEELAAAWGWTPSPAGDGKVVWAVLEP